MELFNVNKPVQFMFHLKAPFQFLMSKGAYFMYHIFLNSVNKLVAMKVAEFPKLALIHGILLSLLI